MAVFVDKPKPKGEKVVVDRVAHVFGFHFGKDRGAFGDDAIVMFCIFSFETAVSEMSSSEMAVSVIQI